MSPPLEECCQSALFAQLRLFKNELGPCLLDPIPRPAQCPALYSQSLCGCFRSALSKVIFSGFPSELRGPQDRSQSNFLGKARLGPRAVRVSSPAWGPRAATAARDQGASESAGEGGERHAARFPCHTVPAEPSSVTHGTALPKTSVREHAFSGKQKSGHPLTELKEHQLSLILRYVWRTTLQSGVCSIKECYHCLWTG